MIKITFEISEDFINEKADVSNLHEGLTASSALEVIKDAMYFVVLKKHIKSGTTEFVVTPDKLDEMSMRIYHLSIGNICALAAFSENDKKVEEGHEL